MDKTRFILPALLLSIASSSYASSEKEVNKADYTFSLLDIWQQNKLINSPIKKQITIENRTDLKKSNTRSKVVTSEFNREGNLEKIQIEITGREYDDESVIAVYSKSELVPENRQLIVGGNWLLNGGINFKKDEKELPDDKTDLYFVIKVNEQGQPVNLQGVVSNAAKGEFKQAKFNLFYNQQGQAVKRLESQPALVQANYFYDANGKALMEISTDGIHIKPSPASLKVSFVEKSVNHQDYKCMAQDKFDNCTKIKGRETQRRMLDNGKIETNVYDVVINNSYDYY